MFNRVAEYWNGLPDWVRTFIRRALLSSFLLTLVSHAATHWYALRYGARVPLEGVPFLVVMSIVASFLLSLASLATLLLVPLGKNFEQTGRFPARPVQFDGFRDESEAFRAGVRRGLIEVGEFVTRPVVVFLALPTLFFLAFFLVPWIFRYEPPSVQWIISYFAIVIVCAFLIAALLRRLTVEVFQRTSIAIYFLAILSLSVAMHGPLFDQILRSTRYGGGIEVDVIMNDGEKVRSGNLFLISSNNVTLWNRSNGRFEEVNVDQIDYITYQPKPLWVLPDVRSLGAILSGTESGKADGE